MAMRLRARSQQATVRAGGPGDSSRPDAGRVTCDGICKEFERGNGTLEVLRDVSFDVQSGQFVSIVGPSGCGKSTLLRIIDGLAPANAGQVSVGGKPVDGPGPDRAFVFQADSLMPWRTVERNVGYGLELRGARDRGKGVVDDLLALTGLSDFAKRYPHELSGGMRQRANLARAIAVDPVVLLMDEPFASLDAQTRELMQAEVLRLWRELQKTVLFVTHSIEEAVYMSDSVLLMSSRPGHIAADIPIRLPRPRTIEMRRTSEFTEVSREIWERLRDDVLRAFEHSESIAS